MKNGRMVAKENACYGEWLLRKVVAMEKVFKGRRSL